MDLQSSLSGIKFTLSNIHALTGLPQSTPITIREGINRHTNEDSKRKDLEENIRLLSLRMKQPSFFEDIVHSDSLLFRKLVKFEEEKRSFSVTLKTVIDSKFYKQISRLKNKIDEIYNNYF